MFPSVLVLADEPRRRIDQETKESVCRQLGVRNVQLKKRARISRDLATSTRNEDFHS